MSVQTNVAKPEIIYPDSDGQAMSDNTLQFEWIAKLAGALEFVFREEENVFVAGDLLWYPLEGEPTIRKAPDALVVFGRPKGHRGSYKQWEEDNVAPQVVFEVMSPSNTMSEMIAKFDFYQGYGVEEFYILDPKRAICWGWNRPLDGEILFPVQQSSWTSPRLGIQIFVEDDELEMCFPGGESILTYAETRADLMQQRKIAETERQAKEKALAEIERLKALLKEQGNR
jgi:Uma2 family endonuclease